MKTLQKIASARTPDNEELTLWLRGGVYSIRVGREELMTSRAHESELELARLGCARACGRPAPSVLIGGLGMGYTLRAALDLLGPRASVTVCELIPDVVAWNRTHLGALNGHPLRDPRVTVAEEDVVRVIAASENRFDAVLLDVDNGPEALTSADNDRLYSREGLRACVRALRGNGCFAVWSGAADRAFERRLSQERLAFRRFDVPAYPGAKARSRCVWVAAREPSALPAEGLAGGATRTEP